jgi:hypothetical protein
MGRLGGASRDDKALAAGLSAGRPMLLAAALSSVVLAACGDSGSTPTPQPTPVEDSWFTFVVQCSGCPGLTNAAIDRTVTPHRARLRVGQLTSLRAASRDGCEAGQNALQITRWVPGDPSVLKVEPSGSDSAIVTALAPGLSSVTVERQLPSGGRSERGLRDAQTTSGCGLLPELVFEIVP